MIRSRIVLFFALGLLALWSCQEDKIDPYARPEWLAGKVYTQLKLQPELSTFAKCLELTEFDKLLDVSGSYTVFAPTNDAFTQFFQSHPTYKKVEDIPKAELERIVRYHILQNPWSKNQLRSLDVFGWIDPKDPTNNEPRGYKRQTLLLDKDPKYGIFGEYRNLRNYLSIVDTTSSPWRRREALDSRKYAPIFFKEYFDIYELSSADYEFYFNRPIESPSDLYYAGAKVLGQEVFAENGFVYKVDRVVLPLKNAYQILASPNGSASYRNFLNFINTFPEFTYNDRKTMAQAGASEGLRVDSLFDLAYPLLTFNINRERTKAPPSTFGLPDNVSVRYHHGLIAPTNEAFDAFVQEYLVGGSKWGSIRNTPDHIRRIIANTYMSVNPIYPTDMSKGFYNGELDIVKLDPTDVVHKEYGSNSTFIGVKKAIVPRAFKSVTGPIYTQRGYSRVMYAIQLAGLLPALKRQNQDYMLFVESDESLRTDSSLVYDEARNRFSVFVLNPGSFQEFGLTTNDLRTMLMNHIALEQPKRTARVEFIPNMNGNFIVVNNVTGEVRGTDVTTKGFSGTQTVQEFPKKISDNADNGTTWEVNNWFSFSAIDLYNRISTSYPAFHNIMRAAGLALEKEYRYSFISESEYYTVFVPNDAALANFSIAGKTVEELQRFVMMHFVTGHIMFTDGKKPAGYYVTARVDESSSQFATFQTQLRIVPGTDVIRIMGKDGSTYLEVPESPLTNTILARVVGTGTEVIRNTISYGVIHEINKVLNYSELDTK